MPRRAAGGDHDALDLEQVLVGDVQPAQPHRSFFLEQPAPQRIPQALGLLHDFFEHEVGVPAPLHRAQVPVDVGDRLFLLGGRPVEDAVLVRPQHGDFLVVQVDHRTRVRQHRRRVGRHPVLALADRHEQLAARQHRDPVRAFDVLQGPHHGVHQRRALGVQLLDQVREHFGIGLGAEAVAALGERRAQRARVLDDPVVDQRDGAAAVGVRVGVLRVRRPVGGPARVGEGRRARRQLRAQLLLEHGDLPRRLEHLDAPVAHDGEPGRIVPAVLEPFQSLEHEGGRRPRAGVAYDPAHSLRPSSISPAATAPVGASAISRMMGSVFDGRTCSQRSGHASRSPSRSSVVASGNRRLSTA